MKDKDLDKPPPVMAIWISPTPYCWQTPMGQQRAINYLQEAKYMIADIMQYEINHKTWSVLLSNAIEYDSKDYFDTRSSDFMPANFNAFEQATAIRAGAM